MKKIYSTIHGLTKLAAFVAMFTLSQSANAQCSLTCNQNIQVSLDGMCQAEITPEMLLNDQLTSCPDGVFIVELRDANGELISSDPAIITGAHVNQTIEAKVIDMVSGNSCWGFALIEDKLAPVISCTDTIIGCAEVANYLPTVVDNCDPNPMVTLLSETETVLDCDPDYIKSIVRTYMAEDAQGNESGTCSQTILVERIDLTLVEFPIDLSQANGNPIPCDFDYPVDDEGNPHPSYTGVPTLENNDLYPNIDLACNAITSYSDIVLPVVGGVQKIMRTWTVNEWYCGGSNDTMDIQIIEILDNVAPILSCPSDYEVSTSAGSDCEAYVLLPEVEVNDNCSPTVSVDVTYPGGFLDDSNGGLVTLPIGENVITYTAYDQDLNSSSCSFTITVEDNTAPVVVCDQFTVVSLSLDGTAYVNATTFDDGSYDDCTSIEFSAKRMDNGSNCGVNNSSFGDKVPFCCTDIGEDVMVILRVTDAAGNYNDCMVSVEVQDKLPPQITCPDNVTVECDYPFDFENLETAFGEATASDNCNVTMTSSYQVNLNMCGTGNVRRFFTATDPNGSVSCVQTITVINSDLFDGDTDIVWPNDVTINECVDPSTIGPDQTGYPQINEDACDQVGSSHTDKIFELVNGENACSKIIRTWTVVDWCQQTNGQYIEWSYQQTIMIINTDGPDFDGDFEEISVCTYDPDCASGEVTLGASANDDCTTNLEWRYSIDLDNDGDFDFVSTTTTGESVDASGSYPIGSHRVVYTTEDGCGNSISREQLFNVTNCKLPTPYCINGLALALMPVDTDGDGEADNGMVEIWASDFDKGSYHPCGYDVELSFSSDINNTSLEYTCNELGENFVQLWATVVLPDGTLLQDYCTATLDIQDNNNVCEDGVQPITVDVTGTIKDEISEAFSDSDVKLDGGEMTTQTDEDGYYAFPNMPLGGVYSVIPNKDGNDINGISTLDIILIQKHILDLKLLATPYKMIAADVNADLKISGSDIVMLRKLILGYYDELPATDSWRFVDEAYKFLDESNPLIEDFPEFHDIPELNANTNIDFIAIKVGDVNNTAKANIKSNATEVRSNEDLTFVTNDSAYNAGEDVTIEIESENFEDILGFQFTLEFDANKLVYKGLNGAAINISNEVNVGTSKVDQGIINISWDTREPISISEMLFAVQFEAIESGKLSTDVTINSSSTQAVAYDSYLEALDIEMEYRDTDGQLVGNNSFELYQNVPNPFATTTQISFNLPVSQIVEINIFDVSGKLVSSQRNSYAKGMNSVELDLNNITTTGVMYYQVKTDNNTATRKMVVLK